MKVRLEVSAEREEAVKAALFAGNVEIADDAAYVLSESGQYPDWLPVREPASGARRLLAVKEIVLIESFGHTVEVRTQDAAYLAADRLYRLQAQLDPEQFLRVSNSAIVAKRHVEEIAPTFSMKFVLKMSNGARVDVTRGYYASFKNSFGF